MSPRLPLLILTLALTLAPSVQAQTSPEVPPVEQAFLSGLKAQGFVVVEYGYTWLGRLRFVAVNGKLRRELVVDPATGEVLRDYAELIQDTPRSPVLAQEDSGSGGGATTSHGATTTRATRSHGDTTRAATATTTRKGAATGLTVTGTATVAGEATMTLVPAQISDALADPVTSTGTLVEPQE